MQTGIKMEVRNRLKFVKAFLSSQYMNGGIEKYLALDDCDKGIHQSELFETQRLIYGVEPKLDTFGFTPLMSLCVLNSLD